MIHGNRRNLSDGWRSALVAIRRRPLLELSWTYGYPHTHTPAVVSLQEKANRYLSATVTARTVFAGGRWFDIFASPRVVPRTVYAAIILFAVVLSLIHLSGDNEQVLSKPLFLEVSIVN